MRTPINDGVLQSDLDVAGFRVIELPDPVAGGDAANKDYVDASGVHELPTGGTTGQSLTKVDGTDYNVHWSTVTGGGGGSGTVDTTGTPAANQIPIWSDADTLKGTTGLTVDSDSNLFANQFVPGVNTITSSGATATLTAASKHEQRVIGSTTHTIKLPSVSTVVIGTTFMVRNLSTGNVTVQASDGSTITTLGQNTAATFTSNASSGTTSAWDIISSANLLTSGGALGTPSSGDTRNCTGGLIVTGSYSANHTLAAPEVNGAIIYVTAAATMTLPAVAAGMNVKVVTIGSVAVSVDPNASEVIFLNGTALTGGHKITNLSTSGDKAQLTYKAAGQWYADTNGWTDGG